MAFSGDGGLLAIGGEDGLVRLWNVNESRFEGEPLAGLSRAGMRRFVTLDRVLDKIALDLLGRPVRPQPERRWPSRSRP